ncbi:MAG: purine-nucleoside phosphorylase [Candidatus Kapabacteria bacterium]|jgi:purine-nucleoside phosphorylase|nr:purine-nucleoside phosphorylase [Candidatus Kapabacteria bacterium]
MEQNNTLKEKINQTIEKIREVTDSKPRIGIILGTGLGGVVDKVAIKRKISYTEIPHFPLSTVETHAGNLLFANENGKELVIMQGRTHFYEGYSMKEITFPIYVMKALGVKYLMVSNTAGSVNPYIPRKSIMLIDDHINLLGDNPLIGKNDSSFGPRFPDMSQPYSRRLMNYAEEIALEEKIKIYKGVYAAMTGPSIETRAEYRMLRAIGADVVGMSTVPECIVANYLGMEVFGASIITDECSPDALVPLTLEEILDAARTVEPSLVKLIVKLIEKL